VRHVWMTFYLGIAMATFACAATSSENVAAPAADPSTSKSHDVSPCDDGRAWQEAFGTLAPSAVNDVDPLYMWDTCVGAAQVSGTKITFASSAVQSALWTQLRSCRGAHVLFPSSAPERRRSLLSGADGWVDIAIATDNAKVILRLSAESVHKNIRLYQEMHAFARASR
jgi:hypothetical protein